MVAARGVLSSVSNAPSSYNNIYDKTRGPRKDPKMQISYVEVEKGRVTYF